MITTITLADFGQTANLSKKRSAQILGFEGPHEMTERLRELGLRQGSVIEYVGQAPFFGPRLYRVGSIVLALRAEEAACVSIQPIEETN